MKIIEKENVYDEWADLYIESVISGKLHESLGKYLPFKVKKKGGLAYYATFNVEITEGPETGKIYKYQVEITKATPQNVSSDYGKVRTKFNGLTFKEASASYGIATLPGHTGMYVLNTVARIVLNFVQESNSPGLHFTASEASRRKAYRALTLMLQKASGHVNITKDSAMNTGSFYLMRKDLFEGWQDAINQSVVS